MARVIGADGLVVVSSLTQQEAHDYLQELTHSQVYAPGTEFWPDNPVDSKLYSDKRAELVAYLKTFPVQI